MIATLLLLAQATSPIQLGTVDIAGRQVAVNVPAVRGPFSENTPSVTIGGYRFEVTSGLNLGRRFKSDGGWGEVADDYPQAALKSASAPEYRIKVLIYDNTSIVEQSSDGVWRERYGSLSPAQKEEVFSALARLKALAETAAQGNVRLTFDVTIDSDLLFRFANDGNETSPLAGPNKPVSMTATRRPAGSGLLGADWVYEEIGPRINNDLFEAEDGKYRGPYSSVFVIHAMRTADTATYVLDRTPVTTLSWATFTDREPGTALSIQMFHAWLQHLGLAAEASFRESGFSSALPVGEDLPQVPFVYDTPVTSELLKAGNRYQTPQFGEGKAPREPGTVPLSADAGNLLQLARITALPDGVAVPEWLDKKVVQAGRFTLVHPAVLPAYVRSNPQAKAYARLSRPEEGWDRVVFEGGTGFSNDLDALNLELGSFPATRMIGPAPTMGTLGFVVSTVGEFEATTENDPVVGNAVVVNEKGENRRGYVVLASSDGLEGLIRVEQSTNLIFKASCDLADPYVLRLVTKTGRTLDVQIFGSSIVPSEMTAEVVVLDAKRRQGPFWNDFVVPIGSVLSGEEVTEVRLAPPLFGSYYERLSDGTKSLKIGPIKFGPESAQVDPIVEPVNQDMEWLQSLNGTVDVEAASRLKSLIKSDNVSLRMNVLGTLTRVKAPTLVPDVGPLASSGFAGEAFLAVQALKFQDTNQAWSQVALTAVQGPFGVNFMFAAEALGQKKEDLTLEVLGMPLLSLSWHARLAAVKSFNNIDTEQAAVVASATLGGSEPDPAVRFAIVNKRRPESGLFARRLLFAAVNDESEWVRAASYVAMIDSENEEIRDQALRGVRDESVAVRLAILEAMQKGAKDYYRPALRMAVIDTNAVVRAAALRAFAAQPGAVLLEEVQNTVNDSSPLVVEALKELAKAKGLEVPPRP